MTRSHWVAAGLVLVAAVGCQGHGGGAQTLDAPIIRTQSGLQYQDLRIGEGPSPQPGQVAVVHYSGWLTSGQKFDSSYDRKKPFQFHLGRGEVIKGWDEGVVTMKVGGKRKLIVPSKLGYGDRGAGATIPGGATLIFEVELLDVK